MRRSVLVLVLLAGCNDFLSPLPSPSRVDSLRLLALTTTTPEVRPGQAVAVRAWWVDPSAPADAPPLFFHWRLCPEEEGADPRNCPVAPGGTDLAPAGSGDVVEIPAAQLPLGTTAEHASFALYVALCRGAPPRLDARLGRFVCARPEFVEATRRITVRRDGALNRPPGVASWALRCGDAMIALPTMPDAPPVAVRALPTGCTAWTLEVTPAEDAVERPVGGAPETLMGSFYASGGRLNRPRDIAATGELRALSARWTPPVGADGGSSSMPWVWAVLRDQRGGETVMAARLALE